MAANPQSSRSPSRRTLARLVLQERRARNLSRAALADKQLSPKFIAAIEDGAVRPSPLVLEFLAQRLNLPLSQLEAAQRSLPAKVDLAAVAEDLCYQANVALRAIRAGDVAMGLRLVEQAEENARPYLAQLPADVRYLLPFRRARAYSQRSEFERAQGELAIALEIAAPDPEAVVNVRNLLGASFYQQQQPDLALEEHLKCQSIVINGGVKDLILRRSVFQNLALDYEALRQIPLAIEAYKAALAAFEDLDDDKLNKARISWGLMMAYHGAAEVVPALAYGKRALDIYEDLDQPTYAASVCLNLAEILLDERRYKEALQMLKKAKWFLLHAGHPGLLSFLYGDLAALALQQGQLDQAAQDAAESIRFAEANSLVPESERKLPITHANRTLAAALQIAALVEEGSGNGSGADELFARAVEQIDKTTFVEAAYTIRLSYANLLDKQGAYDKSIIHYRALAQSRLRSS